MKAVLALIGGGDRDAVIMQTAYAAAIPLGACIDFLHIHVSAGIAMGHSRHAHFVVGAGIKNTLDDFNAKAASFSELAAKHAMEFHRRLEELRLVDGIPNEAGVRVSFRQKNDISIDGLVAEASNSDLIVIGRARQSQGLSPDTLERLVKQCGRPLLVASAKAPEVLPGTVMICWDNSAIVNRAVLTAAPLLRHANRLMFVNVGNDHRSVRNSVEKLRKKLDDVFPAAEVRIVTRTGTQLPAALSAAAADCGADLVVMGAYGRSWLADLIFGSRTDATLKLIDRPIILAH